MKAIKDHKGKEYPSVTALAYDYGITPTLFYFRIKAGYSLEKALTKPLPKRNLKAIDHLGREYKTINIMCEHYKINVATFRARINNGFSVKQALTLKTNREKKCERNNIKIGD